MGDTLNRNTLRRVAITVATFLAATASTFSSASVSEQFPSCMITAEQVSDVAAQDLVEVRIDGHGNFFAGWFSDIIQYTLLDQYGVAVWARRVFPGAQPPDGFWAIDYYTTATLEEKVCSRGKKIVFSEKQFGRRGDYQPPFMGVLPKPYTVVREFAYGAAGAYFLSSLGPDSDFIFTGNVGKEWATTASEFRLPRVGDLVPVHRFFGNLNGGAPSHYFTGDANEAQSMRQAIANGTSKYRYEGIGFYAPRATKRADGSYACGDASSSPVFTMYLPPASASDMRRFRYVIEPSRSRAMQAKGWTEQNATFCAIPG